MTYMLNDIDDAVDGKFLITKKLSNQADMGTMIHIMNTKKNSKGQVKIYYRVTETGQDYDVKFDSIKDFCSWARPDTFIARNYESFSKEEIQHYIKVNNRTFVSFCLPLIIVSLTLVWIVSLLLIGGTFLAVIGLALSVLTITAILLIYKKSKTNAKLRLYQKVSSTKWGIKFN